MVPACRISTMNEYGTPLIMQYIYEIHSIFPEISLASIYKNLYIAIVGSSQDDLRNFPEEAREQVLYWRVVQ